MSGIAWGLSYLGSIACYLPDSAFHPRRPGARQRREFRRRLRCRGGLPCADRASAPSVPPPRCAESDRSRQDGSLPPHPRDVPRVAPRPQRAKVPARLLPGERRHRHRHILRGTDVSQVLWDGGAGDPGADAGAAGRRHSGHDLLRLAGRPLVAARRDECRTRDVDRGARPDGRRRGPDGAIIVTVALGLVFGSTQSLFRSMYAALVPIDRASEYFGFHTLMGRTSAAFRPARVRTGERGDRQSAHRDGVGRDLLCGRRRHVGICALARAEIGYSPYSR